MEGRMEGTGPADGMVRELNLERLGYALALTFPFTVLGSLRGKSYVAIIVEGRGLVKLT
jgi:hypothetical protein